MQDLTPRPAAAWDRELAQQLADHDGIGELSDAHWAVLLDLRQHYLESHALLPASHTCHVNHLEPECVIDLFRNMRQAWRIAGCPIRAKRPRAICNERCGIVIRETLKVVTPAKAGVQRLRTGFRLAPE